MAGLLSILAQGCLFWAWVCLLLSEAQTEVSKGTRFCHSSDPFNPDDPSAQAGDNTQ